MAAYANPTGEGSRQAENLAIAYQEVLTAIARLRANPGAITDVETFRAQMKAALQAAEQESVQRGYLQEDIRLATFAAVAFVDESILNAASPQFADWPRRPLQEELFGIHVAGEIFFRNVERLLAARDSHTLADVLEVYLLCLLMGFRGRYSLGGAGELRGANDAIRKKIMRIRGPVGELSPWWRPPAEAPVAGGDPWIRSLLWTAIAVGAVALVMFGLFTLLLRGGVSSLEAMASRFPF